MIINERLASGLKNRFILELQHKIAQREYPYKLPDKLSELDAETSAALSEAHKHPNIRSMQF